MKDLRQQYPARTWLALLAMLALALLPTLSQALSRSQGHAVNWVEVCTPQGMKQVAVSASDAGAGEGVADGEAHTPTAVSHLENCPSCTQAAHAAVMPAAPPWVPGFSSAAACVPPLFLHAPRTLCVWCTAQSRAPPATT